MSKAKDKPKPRVYLLHGPDADARRRTLERLRAKLGGEGSAVLDDVRLKGENVTLAQLHDAVLTVPFFATRRLVHLDEPLAMAEVKTSAGRKAFLALLEKVPASTALVLEHGEALPPKHWLRRWADEHPEIVYAHLYALPKDLTTWIVQHAVAEGGQFTRRAAAELARRVDGDAEWALNEIHKLLAFVGYARPVTVEDVAELTPAPEHPNIFAMVDAIALGQHARALRLLHQLTRQEDPARIWGMVVRQFRLLILVRAAIDQGLRDQQAIAQRLKIHPFVVGKLIPQARRFAPQTLEQIYRSLWNTDRRWKNGEVDLATALDMLVAALGR